MTTAKTSSTATSSKGWRSTPAARCSATSWRRSRGTTSRTSAARSTRTRSRARCGSPTSLLGAVGSDLGDVTILGGWFGVLGAVLLHDPRFTIGRVVSIDIDPRCAAIAESLNATHVRAGRFAARTADMLEIDYAPPGRPAGAPPTDLVINTSCEHLAAVRPLVRAHPGRASGWSCSRTTISPATSTSTAFPISRPSAPRRRCATCCSPASAGCGATSASC